MVEEGTDVAPFESFTLEDAGGEKAPPKQEEAGGGAEASEPADSGSKTAPPSSTPAEPTKSQPSAQESESTGGRLEPSIDRESAAPAVKKLALEKGVPLSQIKGTGPGGRITKSDVEKFKPAAPTAATSTSSAGASYEDEAPTSMRKTIAARLTESFNQNPHYFVSSSISVSKLLKLRAALNTSAKAGEYKLSVNDFLIKGVAAAARKVPAANSSWRESGGQVVIRKHNAVDVSVAVATPVGLMTPIVKNVNGIGLQSISASVKELGGRAREGKLKPEEYQGGTITISNMGMNPAVERFTAVINPPQATILAVGTTKKVPIPAEAEEGEEEPTGVKWDDQIVITGSFDHKVVDGAVGGEFMRELKKVLENPLELLL